jgi:nitrogen regulatory protein PII
MMIITAVVVPSRLAAVRRALGVFGVYRLTQSTVFAENSAVSRVEFYRGSRRVVPQVERIRLDLLAPNADTPDLARVITRAAGPDIQLWVTRVDHLVRIRTGEVGLDAL